MAADSQAHAVKSLNTSGTGKRFVFKTFWKKVDEIDINVFRSVQSLKSEPSEGSSFFRDALIYWRELNTAEDFISFYEQAMPIAQTLPQILLHKDMLIAELLSRVHMKAKLSIEAILGLLVDLSRDILEEFIPFLPKVVESFDTLLKSGGDHDPEILEQVFTAWSYVMLYLQKYIVNDAVKILKITSLLRYYPKDHVQEFMAEAVSFLLRSAPVNQLDKGIRKLVHEAIRNPSPVRKKGAVALLWHIMRGTSSSLHSKAEHVLSLLFSSSIFSIQDKLCPDSDTTVLIISGALQKLLKEIGTEKVDLVWSVLLDKIRVISGLDGSTSHIDNLLSILISTLQLSRADSIDYKSILDVVNLLMDKYIRPAKKLSDDSSKVVDKILLLMSSLLNVPFIYDDISISCSISNEWAPAFKLGSSSLMLFMEELLLKETNVLLAFRGYIMSALDSLIDLFPEKVLSLMLTLYDRQESTESDDIAGNLDVDLLKISSFFEATLSHWINLLKQLEMEKENCEVQVSESELVVLWGVLRCYTFCNKNQKLLLKIIDHLDQLLDTDTEIILGLAKSAWQGILGTALSQYYKLLLGSEHILSEVGRYLQIAKRNKSSKHILSSVADFLDSVVRLSGKTSAVDKFPELDMPHAEEAISIFSDNLCLSNKAIRLATLKILSHYTLLSVQLASDDERPNKKPRADQGGNDIVSSNAVLLLLSIESTEISVSTSRKIIMSISRIQMGLDAAKFADGYMPLLLSGIIGIFHNRFSSLWGPAMECFSTLMQKEKDHLWNRFVLYLENYQSYFLSASQCGDKLGSKCSHISDLARSFSVFFAADTDSTPCATVLALLLQSLQKVPHIAESCSRQLIPLFFRFLGYADDRPTCVINYDTYHVNRKEWRKVAAEWLELLGVMQNAQSLYCNKFLKDVLVYRLLDEPDSKIQLGVLECLLNWKDNFLVPYEHELKGLITPKDFKETITRWSLSKDSDCIHDGHRENLIPVVIRILIPKVRTIKMLSSNKNAGTTQRKALLSFLAQLDVSELPLLYWLLLKHPFMNHLDFRLDELQINEVDDLVDSLKYSSLTSYFASLNSDDKAWKKVNGFLHVFSDILKTFDESRVRPFMRVLLMIIVKILEACSSRLSNGFENENISGVNSSDDVKHDDLNNLPIRPSPSTTVNKFKEMRSICLRVLFFVLNKYDDLNVGSHFWTVFFWSVKPLLHNIKVEASGSQNPSPLLCCLVAMSRSLNYLPLLDNEHGLVPGIFSILTVKSAGEAVISSVLTFVENLLNLDKVFKVLNNEGKSPVTKILMPHIKTLVHSFSGLSERHKKLKRTEVRILKLLAIYVNEPSVAHEFLEIVLPFLRKKNLSPDECIEMLDVIRGIIPIMDGSSVAKTMSAIESLLVFAEGDIRTCICDLVDDLASNDSSLVLLASLLHKLNAMSASELGELDYDTRISAYDTITPALFQEIRQDHTLVIISHCVYDMSSKELILRQGASSSLLSFIQFASVLLDNQNADMLVDQSNTKGKGSDVEKVNSHMWSKACVFKVINRVFLRNIGLAMDKDSSIQKEWVSLLREMAFKLPSVAALSSLRALCSEDPEEDFFNNILHLQIHRRVKALARFNSVINGGNLSEKLATQVFVPLFFSMMFDVKDGKGEHIRSAFLDSLACISGQMQWSAYLKFLVRCVREMVLKPEKQKLLLRLVCSVLDKFHFSTTESKYILEKPGSLDLVSDINIKESGSISKNKHIGSYISPEIQEALQTAVLPQILKLLNSDTERLNVNVSLAALKLLKLLCLDSMELHLPTIVHRICNFLKNRLQSIRDEARDALVACLKELGLEYLHFIIKALRATLKRGFELHVLGYTLYFLLSKIFVCPVAGSLDYCLEDLLLIVENDILGGVSEEKEVDKIASKMKETKNRMSFDSLKLISQNVTFKTHALKLLVPIKPHMQRHLTAKIKAKLEKMLRHIALGIKSNPSVDRQDLFIFVYGLLDENSIIDDLKEKNFVVKNGRQMKKKMSESCNPSNSSEYGAQSSQLIKVFGLDILQNYIKNAKLDKEDGQLLSMLDPFVRVLGECLNSSYEEILVAALKCLIPLIRLPLPSINLHANKLKILLLHIAQKSPNARTLLAQSCLKLLTVLLTKSSLSADQLHMLIQFPLFVDIQTKPSPVALSLLKQIVTQKLEVPELYDIVSKIAELMVTSQEEPIRRKCSNILLKFLLDYPLSEKRRQQHLNFLLTNLSYEHPSGREAALEMLNAILVKFPRREVDSHAQTIFCHLVVALSNEQDAKVHSMIAAVMKILINRISRNALHQTLEYSLTWYFDKKQHLWGAAAQVLGFLIDVLKEGFEEQLYNILRVANDIIVSCCPTDRNNALEQSGNAQISHWKEAYYSLAMFEKMLLHFPNLYEDSNIKELWVGICECLLHPHVKLKNISSQLLVLYFARVCQSGNICPQISNTNSLYLMNLSRLFQISVACCKQLDYLLVDDPAGNLISQNIVFALCSLHSFAKNNRGVPVHDIWLAFDAHDRRCFLDALDLLGSKKVKNSILLLATDIPNTKPETCNPKDHNDAEDLQSLLVASLLKKLGKTAFLKADRQMKVVFHCYRMIATKLGSEDCRDYAVVLLEPLYKVCEGFAGRVISDEVKSFAEEVRNSIRKVLGSEHFIQAYNKIRKKLKEKRDNRRQDERLLAVTDPARSAKRKLRISAKHRAHKKRKIMGLKLSRWNSR